MSIDVLTQTLTTCAVLYNVYIDCTEVQTDAFQSKG